MVRRRRTHRSRPGVCGNLMCGIAGIVNRADSQALAAMVRAMAHRGPDDHGTYVNEQQSCALGHTRLSIIDTSRAGHQPMLSANGALAITYNGEVYNYRDIRRELEASGDVFHTETDTEVVLRAYERWGADAVVRFRGMFAFAIWDERKQELFLARDRLGIKPLYYQIQRGRLVFGSELKALLASGLVERRADPESIAWYMALGAVPQPRTIIEGVAMLPAGHTAVFSGGALTKRRYWAARDFLNDQPPSASGDFADAASRLRELLEDATRQHLIADVPVGAFLSGGIDSRIVVGLMSRVTADPIRTFSVGFSEDAGVPDERAAARGAAQEFGCDHTEVVLTPADFIASLESGVESLDQPSIDGFNTYIVSRAARHTVTVALSGLGGDELFGGYPHMNRFAKAARLAPHGSSVLRALLRLMPERTPGRLRLPLQHLAGDPLDRLSGVRQQLSPARASRALDTALSRFVTHETIRGFYERLLPGGRDAGNAISVVEVDGYLCNTLLRDCDAMSMAHSLEVRPVLLDHVVCEYALGLPSAWKNGDGVGKRILLAACQDLLPPGAAQRPKTGFELPLSRWLTRHAGSLVADRLRGNAAQTVFSRPFLTGLREAAEGNGDKRSRSRLWQCFILLDYLERLDLCVAA